MREVEIAGAAMTRFGRYPERTGRNLVEETVAGALRDADLGPHRVEAAFVGNAAAGLMTGQESIRAQVVLRQTGLMGVPMVNLDNACASGSTALHLGWQAVATGMYDHVVVVGYETLSDASPAQSLRALNASADQSELSDLFGSGQTPARSAFADLYGALVDGGGQSLYDPEALALVSVKNHHHGVFNPCARYRAEVTVEQVLGARPVSGPLTALMCASLSDGAACVVLRAHSGRSRGRRPRIGASVLTSGRGDDLGRDLGTVRAVRNAYSAAGAGPEDLDVIELHDATSVTELVLYEQLGICRPGEAERLVRDRTTWLGGSMPVNPSGGMLARGHPMGATGLAQVIELVWQMQGRCGERQVAAARVGLAQNFGGWIGTDAAASCVHVITT
jgi:acetyl-CoA acetyltransferase